MSPVLEDILGGICCFAAIAVWGLLLTLLSY